jgi:hypothetical protein
MLTSDLCLVFRSNKILNDCKKGKDPMTEGMSFNKRTEFCRTNYLWDNFSHDLDPLDNDS